LNSVKEMNFKILIAIHNLTVFDKLANALMLSNDLDLFAIVIEN